MQEVANVKFMAFLWPVVKICLLLEYFLLQDKARASSGFSVLRVFAVYLSQEKLQFKSRPRGHFLMGTHSSTSYPSILHLGQLCYHNIAKQIRPTLYIYTLPCLPISEYVTYKTTTWPCVEHICILLHPCTTRYMRQISDNMTYHCIILQTSLQLSFLIQSYVQLLCREILQELGAPLS